MKKLLSTRLIESISKKHDKDIASFIEESIKKMNDKCPSCKKDWPKKEESRVRISARVGDDVATKVESKYNSSKYIFVASLVNAGHCPLCEQKIK